MKNLLVDVAYEHKLMIYHMHGDRGEDLFQSKKKKEKKQKKKKKTHCERKG